MSSKLIKHLEKLAEAYYKTEESPDFRNNMQALSFLLSNETRLVVDLEFPLILLALKENKTVTEIEIESFEQEHLVELFVDLLETNTTIKKIILKEFSALDNILNRLDWSLVSFEELEMNGGAFNDEGLQELCSLINPGCSLKKLSLIDCNVTDKDLIYISDLVEAGILHQLALPHNEVGTPGVYHLIEAIKRNPNFTYLDVSNNQIGDAGLRYIGELLKQKNGLKTVNVGGLKEYDNGYQYLADGFTLNNQLEHISLFEAPLFPSFIKGLVIPSLKSLRLDDCGIDDRLALYVAEVIKCTNLVEVDLSRNKFGAGGIYHITEAIKFKKDLVSLDLCGNPIGSEGFKHIGNLLTTSHIRRLILDATKIETQGMINLVKGLNKNQKLESLFLENCDFTKQGIIVLFKALRNNIYLSGLYLYLHDDSLLPHLALSLSDMLKYNQGLRKLSCPLFKDEDYQIIQSGLQINNSLVWVGYADSNYIDDERRFSAINAYHELRPYTDRNLTIQDEKARDILIASRNIMLLDLPAELLPFVFKTIFLQSIAPMLFYKDCKKALLNRNSLGKIVSSVSFSQFNLIEQCIKYNKE
ncbi:hypothetical protein HK103_006793 [Boothiomyces macroporosus]|uniref:Uncharacterized protein n=1 Tax=Boothiomyces macroporosus TaxID=261099 RepID=A0AAD5Y6U1_9FUNG|nr:hypothetical protein HK103_006793 [Boothiomyces macroporosus]